MVTSNVERTPHVSPSLLPPRRRRLCARGGSSHRACGRWLAARPAKPIGFLKELFEPALYDRRLGILALLHQFTEFFELVLDLLDLVLAALLLCIKLLFEYVIEFVTQL